MGNLKVRIEPRIECNVSSPKEKLVTKDITSGENGLSKTIFEETSIDNLPYAFFLKSESASNILAETNGDAVPIRALPLRLSIPAGMQILKSLIPLETRDGKDVDNSPYAKPMISFPDDFEAALITILVA